MMQSQFIQVEKKGRKSADDEYKVFSIRVKSGIIDKLDELAEQTNRSRNELINLILVYGVEHIEIV